MALGWPGNLVLQNNNNNKRPLTPKSMPPTGDKHAKLKLLTINYYLNLNRSQQISTHKCNTDGHLSVLGIITSATLSFYHGTSGK